MGSVLLGICLLFIYSVFELNKISNEFSVIEANRNVMISKSEELRHSSDNLMPPNDALNKVSGRLSILIILESILFIAAIVVIRKRVLIPVKSLTQAILSFGKGEKNLDEIHYYLDERSMFLEGPVVIFKWRNAEGWPIEYVSSNVEMILGYTQDHFLNKGIQYSDIIDKKYQEKVAEEVSEAIDNRVKHFDHLPYEIIRKTGEKIYISDHTSLIYDEDGNITHFLGYITDISTTIAIENELIKSKNTIERYLNIAAEIILTLDENGMITLLNESGHKLLGYENGTLIGKNWFEISVPKTIVPEVKTVFKNLMEGNLENVENYENSLLTREGNEITVYWHNTLLKDDNGRIIGVLSSGENITLYKQAELALKESETKFRILADYTTDWEYWVLPDDNYKYVSPSCKAISGYSNEEFIENPELFFDIIHPDYKDMMKDHFHFSNENKAGHTGMEFMIKAKDGQLKWLENFCKPIFNDKKIFLGLRGSNRDITLRKEYESELGKFNVLVAQSPFSIVLTDLEGNINYVNPYFKKITGYSFREIKGRHMRILNSGNTDPKVFSHLWETITKGHNWKGEFQNKKKNGELYWESATITPLKNHQGDIFQYMAIKEDITDKKLLENQLYQSQKMDAIGQFAGGIAHDFNNILTAILGFTEIGLMDNEDDVMLKNIQSSSDRAANLVKKLLGFSRKQIIEPQVLDIKYLIDDLEKMLNRMIGDDISITKNYKNKLPLIFADPGQIEQIIINLIVNARDAINLKTDLDIIKLITINLSQEIFHTTRKENNFDVPSGSYVVISVSDTGIGMDSKTQKKIFEPFYTTKEVGKGTGLGLATVYGIIKQNKGYITVYSEPGIGTTFNIYWPVIETTATVSNKSLVDQNTPLRGNETLILIEDDIDIITMVEKGLTKIGYTVISYSDPVLALKEIPKLDQPIDLLITDVIMPHINGKVLAEKLLAFNPDLNILYSSGYTDDHIVNAGILKKDVNFISKPYNLVKLTHKIKEIIS